MDPLSPMFNTVIDYVLSKLDNNLGITINKHRITNLAFADDLLVIWPKQGDNPKANREGQWRA